MNEILFDNAEIYSMLKQKILEAVRAKIESELGKRDAYWSRIVILGTVSGFVIGLAVGMIALKILIIRG